MKTYEDLEKWFGDRGVRIPEYPEMITIDSQFKVAGDWLFVENMSGENEPETRLDDDVDYDYLVDRISVYNLTNMSAEEFDDYEPATFDWTAVNTYAQECDRSLQEMLSE